MPSKMYLITGGARSGKSKYAQQLCESWSSSPIYLATSTPNNNIALWDDDFTARVHRHQVDRGNHWTTLEEPISLSQHRERLLGKVVLVDCITLWLTNYFCQEGLLQDNLEAEEEGQPSQIDLPTAAERVFTNIQKEFDRLTSSWNTTFVFVTNEIGSGIHGKSRLSRYFVDVQSWFNQYVASKADTVILMVCGCLNILKEKQANTSVIPSTPKHKVRFPHEVQTLDDVLSQRNVKMDPNGYFLINVDHEECLIRVSYHSSMVNEMGEIVDFDGTKIECKGPSPPPMQIWKGRTAKELTIQILEEWQPANVLLSASHAGYLGREVQKAEYALYSGTKYNQD